MKKQSKELCKALSEVSKILRTFSQADQYKIINAALILCAPYPEQPTPKANGEKV